MVVYVATPYSVSVINHRIVIRFLWLYFDKDVNYIPKVLTVTKRMIRVFDSIPTDKIDFTIDFKINFIEILESVLGKNILLELCHEEKKDGKVFFEQMVNCAIRIADDFQIPDSDFTGKIKSVSKTNVWVYDDSIPF